MTSPPKHFDPSRLHRNAALAIDKGGLDLIEMIQPHTPTPPAPPAFETRTPPKTKIRIDSPPVESAYADQMGRVTGRLFINEGEEWGLLGDGYRQLRLLVENISRAGPFVSCVSRHFLEVETFKWCRAKLCGDSSDDLSAWLLCRCEEAVIAREIAVPLAFVEVETPFSLGKAIVAPLDPIVFDRADESFARNHPKASAQSKAARARMRDDYANRTVVVVQIVGDEEFADQRAREIASDMAVVLRFLSPAAISHDVTCLCFPMGAVHIPRTTVLRIRGDELVSSNTKLAEFGLWDWKLTTAFLDAHRTLLQSLARFFEDKPLSDFQKRVWSALAIYAEAIATSDRARRLVLAMSSAELILLGGTNEVIQASVADRMAFMLAKDGKDRRAIVTNFKRAYQLRSRHVHHARSVDDDEVLANFFLNMFKLLFATLTSLGRFHDHDEFLAAIERIKYGG